MPEELRLTLLLDGRAKANSTILRLSEEEYESRQRLLTAGVLQYDLPLEVLQKILGIKGENLGVACIRYLSPTDSYPLPVRYLLLRGVLLDLL